MSTNGEVVTTRKAHFQSGVGATRLGLCPTLLLAASLSGCALTEAVVGIPAILVDATVEVATLGLIKPCLTNTVHNIANNSSGGDCGVLFDSDDPEGNAEVAAYSQAAWETYAAHESAKAARAAQMQWDAASTSSAPTANDGANDYSRYEAMRREQEQNVARYESLSQRNSTASATQSGGQPSENASRCMTLEQPDGAGWWHLRNSCSREVWVQFCVDNPKSSFPCNKGHIGHGADHVSGGATGAHIPYYESSGGGYVYWAACYWPATPRNWNGPNNAVSCRQ